MPGISVKNYPRKIGVALLNDALRLLGYGSLDFLSFPIEGIKLTGGLRAEGFVLAQEQFH